MARPFRVYDSLLLQDYPDQGMYAAAYEPLWQSIRLQCRDQWGSIATARACCARLSVYMDKVANERPVRMWRVYNLLNAIPINKVDAHGIHNIDMETTDYIIAFRKTVRDRYLQLTPPSEWDWAVSRHGLQVLAKSNPDWIKLIIENLKQRPIRNRVKPELEHFLDLCYEVTYSTT